MKFENIVSLYFGNDDNSIYHASTWENPNAVNKILYGILYRESYCFKDKYSQETRSKMEELMSELLNDHSSFDSTDMSLFVKVIDYLESLKQTLMQAR